MQQVQEASELPPPKTLITPALFSRPLPTPLTGRRGGLDGVGRRKSGSISASSLPPPLPLRVVNFAGLPLLPGWGMGRSGEEGRGDEGLGWGRTPAFWASPGERVASSDPARDLYGLWRPMR